MRTSVLLSISGLLAASSVSLVACSGQHHSVVVAPEVHNTAGDGGQAVSLDQVDHSAWERLVKT
jgi:hypothetical protein